MNRIVFIIMILSSSKAFCQDKFDEYYKNAITYEKNKQWNNALINYQKAIDLVPKDSTELLGQLYWGLSLSQSSLDLYDDAISTCSKWINLDWRRFDAYLLLGLNNKFKKNFRLAIEAYSNALNIIPYNSNFNAQDIYGYIKDCNKYLGNEYGWIPSTQFWKINISHANWESTVIDKTCCIYKFAIRVQNNLPIPIQAVNIDLILMDKAGSTVYKRNHTAWVNNLRSGEISQSDYFNLINELCLPCSYINGGKFKWSENITGIAY